MFAMLPVAFIEYGMVMERISTSIQFISSTIETYLVELFAKDIIHVSPFQPRRIEVSPHILF